MKTYKSGLRVKMDACRYGVSTDRGFRKFFNAQAKLAEMEPLHKEMLLGHKVGLERSHYLKRSDILSMSSPVKVGPERSYYANRAGIEIQGDKPE